MSHPVLQVCVFVLSLSAVVLSAMWVVRTSVRIAAVVGVPLYIVGLTLVAFGTSFPEIMISAMSAIKGSGNMSLGNVLGSNVANVGLALAVSLILGGATFGLSKTVLKVEVPVLIGLHGALWVFFSDQVLARWEGAIIGLAVFGVLVWLFRSHQEAELLSADEIESVEHPQKKAVDGWKRLAWLMCQFVAGCAVLYIGSEWCVDVAIALAQRWGVSEGVIGVSVLAVGTSVPEIVTCVVAGMKGHHRISIGMILGSNMINSGMVLGIAALVTPLTFGNQNWGGDLIISLGATVCVVPSVILGKKWGKLVGVGLLAGYGLYIVGTVQRL